MLPGYLDSHLHLQDPRFNGIRAEVLLRARKAGVTGMFCNATRQEDWQGTLELASPSIFPFIGIHPWYCRDLEKKWERRLEETLETTRCGIGETGLDKRCACDMTRQVQIFTAQLQLAVAFRRPLTVHCLGAWGKLLEILEVQAKTCPLPPILVHSFGGSAEVMRRLVGLGCALSFSARLAAPEQERLRQVFQATPKQHILLETDAPDQLQIGINRGKAGHPTLNEPANIAALYTFAANLHHMELQDFCRQIWQNGTVFTDSTIPR